MCGLFLKGISMKKNETTVTVGALIVSFSAIFLTKWNLERTYKLMYAILVCRITSSFVHRRLLEFTVALCTTGREEHIFVPKISII